MVHPKPHAAVASEPQGIADARGAVSPHLATGAVEDEAYVPPPVTGGCHANNLTLTYSTPRSVTYAVRDVSLRIAARHFAGIVGPSGSGKSSLLYLLSGLKPPTSGSVDFGDFAYSSASQSSKLTFRRSNFGYVFQSPHLVPYLTVLENVLVPLDKPNEKSKKRALELLDALGIVELAPKFPHECSGGERVRAAMARGLVHRPAWLWVDEPTASLDVATGQRVMQVLRCQTEHGALVVVTHDVEILAEADVVFRMRDGRLMEKFSPQERILP